MLVPSAWILCTKDTCKQDRVGVLLYICISMFGKDYETSWANVQNENASTSVVFGEPCEFLNLATWFHVVNPLPTDKLHVAPKWWICAGSLLGLPYWQSNWGNAIGPSASWLETAAGCWCHGWRSWGNQGKQNFCCEKHGIACKAALTTPAFNCNEDYHSWFLTCIASMGLVVCLGLVNLAPDIL